MREGSQEMANLELHVYSKWSGYRVSVQGGDNGCSIVSHLKILESGRQYFHFICILMYDKSYWALWYRDLIPKIKIPMERNFTIREFVESGGPQY